MFRVICVSAALIATSAGAEEFVGVRGALEPETIEVPSASLQIRIDENGPSAPLTPFPDFYFKGLAFSEPEAFDPHRQRVTGNSASILNIFDADSYR